MRRRLNITERRATSVGCAVNTGTISTRLSQSIASSALMPTRRISHKRAGQRAALAPGLAAQLQRDAAALAVIGFGQIDQLEVEGKGAREQNGALHGQRMHQFERLGGVAGGLFVLAAGFGIAAANGALAQRFNVREEVFAGLLAQHFAQQHAQRAHVAAQRSFFQVAGSRFQFGQPLRPALGVPQKGHRVLIMHDAAYEGRLRRARLAPPSCISQLFPLGGERGELRAQFRGEIGQALRFRGGDIDAQLLLGVRDRRLRCAESLLRERRSGLPSASA